MVGKGPKTSDLKSQDKSVREKLDKWFEEQIEKDPYHKNFYSWYKKELESFLEENELESLPRKKFSLVVENISEPEKKLKRELPKAEFVSSARKASPFREKLERKSIEFSDDNDREIFLECIIHLRDYSPILLVTDDGSFREEAEENWRKIGNDLRFSLDEFQVKSPQDLLEGQGDGN